MIQQCLVCSLSWSPYCNWVNHCRPANSTLACMTLACIEIACIENPSHRKRLLSHLPLPFTRHKQFSSKACCRNSLIRADRMVSVSKAALSSHAVRTCMMEMATYHYILYTRSVRSTYLVPPSTGSASCSKHRSSPCTCTNRAPGCGAKATSPSNRVAPPWHSLR